MVRMKKEKGTGDTRRHGKRPQHLQNFWPLFKSYLKAGREKPQISFSLYIQHLYQPNNHHISEAPPEASSSLTPLLVCTIEELLVSLSPTHICILTLQKNTSATKGTTQNSPHLGNGKGLQGAIVSPLYRGWKILLSQKVLKNLRFKLKVRLKVGCHT